MYGLIGKKLGHSFSADFFNKKFANEGINENYALLPIPDISKLPELLDKFPELKGLNVTIPYKKEVIPFLDYLSEEAKEIGAVNVIRIVNKEGKRKLEGYNSDIIGFERSLTPLLRDEIKKALILGTGGASKAVEFVLRKKGIQVTFVSRNPDKGQISYDDIDQNLMQENKLIVNTTPLGMYPDVKCCPDIPYNHLTSHHVCYDLVYNPDQTEFMKKSSEYGAKVKNGLEMLHLQAIAAWDIWNQ